MTRVLFVGSGFCPSRGVAGELPKFLLDAGVDVDVIVPHLEGMDEGEGRLAERLVSLRAFVDGEERSMRLLEGRRGGHVRTFYVEEKSLNARALTLRTDDGIRGLAVFAHAVVQWLMRAPFHYDVVHCDGIEASLVAALMRTSYANDSKLSHIKIVCSVAGIEDKASLDMSWLARIGLPDNMASSDYMEFYGKLSVLKGVYLFADAIVFPNDNIRRKIEKNRGKDIGMEGVLFDRMEKLHHVALGIDTKAFDPAVDRKIKANFSAENLAGKAQCKDALIEKLHLKKNRPVLAFVGCLDSESGIDLINDILDDLMDRNVNLVIAGRGNDKYLEAVTAWKNEFKGSIAVLPGKPSPEVRHEIMSGADIVLLPGKNETLGRQHLLAMRYATVVVARYQGCVVNDINRVRDIDHVGAEENGFAFFKYDSDEFFDAVMDALDVYETPAFNELRTRCAAKSQSLTQTAKDFAELYSSLG